jgi:RNA polymerase sigma factor (sigma-70 family)
MGLPPFQRFLDEYGEDVYRFLVALVGRQEAEDCFQETFLAALRAYPRLRESSNLRAWVLTIAHRKAVDAVRSRGRRPEPVATVPDAQAAELALPDGTVWQAVADLPPKQRVGVVLRHVLDLPYREIARVTGSTEAAARQSVRLASKRLREVLG